MLTFVLLPGMDGSGSFFSPFIEALGASVETQVISYPCDRALNYAKLTRFAEESLPKNAPFVLLGESFSGPIAISIAAAKPVGLKAVILVCTFVCSPIQIPKAFRNIASHVPIRWIPTKIVSKYLLGHYLTKTMEARLGIALSRVGVAVWRERLLSILNVNVSKELSEIDVPFLYIRASQDKIVPKSASQLISLYQPNAVIAEIEGPHFIVQANPTESASSILRFLNDSGIITEDPRS
jgi:pimeloyl-ACP methyl ester carboxylesterase